MGNYLWLIPVGLIAGIAGGMLGIGGSIVMIPALNELFGPRQHLHQAAAMIVNFFVVVPAAYQHSRAKAISWPIVQWMGPAAVVSVVAGVLVSELPAFAGSNRTNLTLLFACFLGFIAARDLYRIFRRIPEPEHLEPAAVPGWKSALLVGCPAGFLGGLLGIGGGIVMVPLQRRFLGVPLRNAIANSATAIVLLSPLGATMKNYAVISSEQYHWWTSLLIAGVLIPTAMVGSSLGGKLTHALPVRQIRIAFIVLLFVFAVRMAVRALGS